MILKAIVGMSGPNRVIGRNGDLPWRLPEDLKWFKKLTMGHPIVMGRKTMESLPRPLPGRRNLVLSRSLSPGGLPDGFEWVSEAELEGTLADVPEAWVIGGSEVYRLLIPRCDEVYLSYVFEEHEGDTFLPPFENAFEIAEVLTKTDQFELRRYVRSSGKRAISE